MWREMLMQVILSLLRSVNAMMRSADIRKAFPMHMWEKYEYIPKFKAMSVTEAYRDRIADITAPNQTFTI